MMTKKKSDDDLKDFAQKAIDDGKAGKPKAVPSQKPKVVDIKKQRDAFQNEKMEQVDRILKAIGAIEGKIKTLTDEKALLFAKLTDAGFSKKGIGAARKMEDMSETDAELFDNTMVFVRHVLKRPLSNTLLAGSVNAAFLKAEGGEREIVEG